MSTLSIVGFAGSPARPSRTRNLVETIVRTAALRADAQAEVYDLTEVHPSLGATLDAREAPPDLAALIDAITAADALVVGSPVYKGTYTGLFKHLFDLIEPKALKNKPIALSATGGSERHALVIDHGLRPLFAFFSADILSAGIYATEADFAEHRPVGPALIARIDRTVDELAWRLLSRAPSTTQIPVATHAQLA